MQPENDSTGHVEEEIVVAELDTSKLSFIERLLSPQSLQWMMACGSGLLILGFAIWLWSVGVFENPIVVAVAAGAATVGLLAGGMSMVLKTRHQLAGRWLTLLGALVLPLNLWLYDAQGLITLANGGHLWIPAALFCLVYAAIARVLRDATFVYALVGGIVLTGMLFLADQTVGRFYQWLPPTKFLLAIGWMSVFADRLFPVGKSDFSRENFGSAFYRSGMVVVVSGLALLLGGFVSVFASSVFGQSFIYDSWAFPLTSIVTTEKVWALGLVIASAIGFSAQGYMRKSKACFGATISLGVWAILITMSIFAVPVTVTSVAIFVAALTIGINVSQAAVQFGTGTNAGGGSNVAISQPVVGTLSLLAVIQMALHLGGVTAELLAPMSWWTVLQFALTAIASWTLAWNAREVQKHGENTGETIAGFTVVGGIMAMVAVWSGIFVQTTFAVPVCVLVAIVAPAMFAMSGLIPRERRLGATPGSVGSAMMTTHLVLLVATMMFGGFGGSLEAPFWAITFAAASIVYFVASRDSAKGMNQVFSVIAAIASIATFGSWAGFEFGYCLVIAPMVAGTAIKVLYSIIGDHRVEGGTAVESIVPKSANFIVFQAGAASVLLSMSRWLESSVDAGLMVVMVVTLACTVLSSFLTKHTYWRTAFRALIIAIVGSCVCVFEGLLNMNSWHRGEMCCLVGGAILLVLGHIAWAREDSDEADAVASVSLVFGSLLMVLPLAIGLIFYRTAEVTDVPWRLFHEIAAITSSLLLLGAGMLCRVRSTTISGAALMLVFLGSLVTLVRLPEHLTSASVVMMIGGAVFLGTAILMSIYRDRIVALPGKVRDGEGVFQVLKWR